MTINNVALSLNGFWPLGKFVDCWMALPPTFWSRHCRDYSHLQQELHFAQRYAMTWPCIQVRAPVFGHLHFLNNTFIVYCGVMVVHFKFEAVVMEDP